MSFYGCRQKYSKLYRERQRKYNSSSNFEIVDKRGETSPLDFNNYSIATEIKTTSYWHVRARAHTHTHTHTQNNGIEQETQREWKLLSCVRLFATPWTIRFMEFSRPEYWSGWPFPSPGDLPNPGIKPRSPASQANSLPAEPQGKPVFSNVKIFLIVNAVTWLKIGTCKGLAKISPPTFLSSHWVPPKGSHHSAPLSCTLCIVSCYSGPKSFLTRNPMDCSMPGSSVLYISSYVCVSFPFLYRW